MTKITQIQQSDLPEEIIKRSDQNPQTLAGRMEKKIPKTQQRSDHLPEEIMEEILSRQDVKSLLRFRCVSKSYRSLIDSKHFIKLHHQKSTRDTTLSHHRVLFFNKTYSSKPKISECSLLSFVYPSSYESASELSPEAKDLFSFIDPSSDKALLSCIKPSCYKAASALNFPTNIPLYKGITLVGWCNGLVCVLLRRDNNIGSQFMLWNPCTRISKEVPHIDKNKMMVFKDLTGYGFGWDESSDDYKIVAIVKGEGRKTTICKIYSLKSDLWTQNDDGWGGLSRSWYAFVRFGVLTTGKLHWMRRGHTSQEEELVAFDLKREVFQMVELPDFLDPLLGTFGECLVGQCVYHDYKEIWVMKEYGVKESWEKVMVLDDFDEYGIWTSPSVAASYNGGIGIGKGGELILMNILYDVKYFAYNQKNKCLYYAPTLDDSEVDIKSAIYIESLVSPLQ